MSGISGIDSLADGRGAIYADFDNDGDLDVFVTTIQGSAHLLFRNNIGQDAAWIRVSLIGNESGRDAFGAVVRVKTTAGVQARIKAGGQGYLSQHDPRLLFGLGSDSIVEWMEVEWPSGRKSRFEGIPAGASLLVTEGEGAYRSIVERPARLPDPIPSNERRLGTLKIRKGRPLPDLDVVTRAGEKVSLRSILPAEKRTLLNLWATWCSVCRREMPELERLRSELQPIGIEVVGLNIDAASQADVDAHLQEIGITYPVFLTGEDTIRKIYPAGNAWVPLTILVSEEGVVLDLFSGYAEIIRELEALTRG